jgi:hypothetical protein
MNTVKAFFQRVLAYFQRPDTRDALLRLADYVPLAVPYVIAAAEIIARETPTMLDDAALTFLRQYHPELFSARIGDEVLKQIAARAIRALLSNRFGLKDNEAGIVVETALLAAKAEGQIK